MHNCTLWTRDVEMQKTKFKMKIKNTLYLLLVLMVGLVGLSSCFKDNEEVVTDERCFISSFTLGSMKRVLHTTNAEGKDSVYTLEYNGVHYPMSIDQKTLTIQNVDSLPYGTVMTAVPATVAFKGILLYKQVDDEEYHTYSSGDSINFSKPVLFKNYSATGLSERVYTVKLNVHQQEGNKFCWERFDGNAEAEGMEALSESRMVAVGSYLYLLGRTADGKVVSYVHVRNYPGDWDCIETQNVDLADADLSTLCCYNGHMLMSNAKGEILQSYNGAYWSVLEEAGAVPGRRLIGASRFLIYAYRDGMVESTWDGGRTWVENALDDEASFLPDSQINLVQAEQNNGYTRLVLMGNREGQADQNVEVWSKAWNKHSSEMQSGWMYYPHTADNRVQCPQMAPLFVLPYDGALIALGGKSLNGKYKTLEKILQSPDYGLTWRTSSELSTPKELHGATGQLSVTVDEDNFIWIASGNQLWRGRLTRLGFAKQ